MGPLINSQWTEGALKFKLWIRLNNIELTNKVSKLGILSTRHEPFSPETVFVKPFACIAYQLAPSTGTDSANVRREVHLVWFKEGWLIHLFLYFWGWYNHLGGGLFQGPRQLPGLATSGAAPLWLWRQSSFKFWWFLLKGHCLLRKGTCCRVNSQLEGIITDSRLHFFKTIYLICCADCCQHLQSDELYICSTQEWKGASRAALMFVSEILNRTKPNFMFLCCGERTTKLSHPRKLFMAANEWSTITWLATYRFVRSPGVHVSPAARVATSDDAVTATGLDEPRGEFTAPPVITCTSRNTVPPIVVLTPPADVFAQHRTRRASENLSFFALCQQLLFIFKTWQCLLRWENIPTLQRTYCASVANI